MRPWPFQLRRAASLLAALAVVCCSHPAKQVPQTAAPQPSQTVRSPAPAPEPDSVDERAIAAAQRALTQLGYPVGTADGVMGPATRRAILTFQKDRGLAEDGQLTQALVNLLSNLVAQLPKINTTTVAAGDTLLFGDGSKEIVKSERVVPWDLETGHGLVAIRPSTAG